MKQFTITAKQNEYTITADSPYQALCQWCENMLLAVPPANTLIYGDSQVLAYAVGPFSVVAIREVR